MVIEHNPTKKIAVYPPYLHVIKEPWGMDGRAMGIPKTEIVLKRTQHMFILGYDAHVCTYTHCLQRSDIRVYVHVKYPHMRRECVTQNYAYRERERDLYIYI